MNQPLVQITNLTIGYPNRKDEATHVVRNLSLTLEPGETLGIVGESGCGKSTLGLALMGYFRVGSQALTGNILIDGRDVLRLKQHELGQLRGGCVGLVSQNAGQSLNPVMRIGTQLIEVLSLHAGLTGHAATQRALELLSQMRLPHPELLLKRYPHQLSGGQQQRVALAMALASAPKLLILDELTTGLDVTTQNHILHLLNDLVQTTDTTLIYISHDLGVIAHVSARVVVMYAGEVVEDAPAEAVFTRPAHPYTHGLLESIPRLTIVGVPSAMPGMPPVLGSKHVGCAFTARCSFATDLCRRTNPTLAFLNSETHVQHQVRCHHWLQVADTHIVLEQKSTLKRTEPSLTTQSVLQLTGVDISYTRPSWLAELRRIPVPPATVSNIDLTIYKGETLALVGESGSGKSTIIRTIAGLKPPDIGQISFDGVDLTIRARGRPMELRKRIQMIFQNPDASLNPSHTVAQILEYPLRLYFALTPEQRQQRLEELLLRVQLGKHYLQRFPGQLSGGEKQRVAIARAFAAEPEVVLCDEVTSALDVSVQAAVLNLLAELQQEQQVTYLFITHDLALVHAFADRVAVLYQGRLCELGTVTQVYAPPFHPYTETLLGAVLEPNRVSQPHVLAKDVPETVPPARGCVFQRRCPRHLGRICDEESPPWQLSSEGHLIRCHLSITNQHGF